MKRIRHKHPLAIRWLHWINFPLLGLMVWSGLLIYWANGVYKLGWGDKTLLKFFPTSFYEALHVPYRLAEGMNIHFLVMWFFAFNGLVYALYLFISGEWRALFPAKQHWKESWLVLLHDLRLTKKKPQQGKYNAAQRVAYTIVIVMGLLMLLTGLAIYKPVQLNWLCALLGGYEWARAEHFIITILFCLFFLVHLLQVLFAGWNNFRAMITGFEILPTPKNSTTSASNTETDANPKNTLPDERRND
jgi:thiosulfate reductase cytochrome b subunit